MNYIWVIDKKSGGYSGESTITETAEMMMLDCDHDFCKYVQIKKTYFNSRKDAEDYIRPIAKKAYELMISNMINNLGDGDGDGDDDKIVAEYKKRGLQEIRCEELTTKDNFLYDLYYCDNPSTLFTCPSEHGYDRIGQYFAVVYRVPIY